MSQIDIGQIRENLMLDKNGNAKFVLGKQHKDFLFNGTDYCSTANAPQNIVIPQTMLQLLQHIVF